MVRKVAASRVEIGVEPRALRILRSSGGAGSALHAREAEQASAETEAYKAAYLEGFDAGHADGDREARAALAEAIEEAGKQAEEARHEGEAWRENLRALADAFDAARERLNADAELLALEVAHAALCQMLGSLHAKRKLLEPLVRKIMHAHSLRTVQVRLAPDDMDAVPSKCEGIEWVADPKLAPGACVVSTPRGDIDGGLEQQLNAIQRQLLSELAGEAGPA